VNTTEALLKGILATLGRTAFPPEALYKIIAPTSGSGKQVAAYNLCDGQTAQAEIGKKAKLDPASLSRSIAKWIEAGVVIRLGAEAYPLHLYPVPVLRAKPARKAG
jgi:hypothetical protein